MSYVVALRPQCNAPGGARSAFQIFADDQDQPKNYWTAKEFRDHTQKVFVAWYRSPNRDDYFERERIEGEEYLRKIDPDHLLWSVGPVYLKFPLKKGETYEEAYEAVRQIAWRRNQIGWDFKDYGKWGKRVLI